MISYIDSGPCKDCTKRNATCHGTCKDYLEWRDRKQASNHRIKQKHLIESYARHDKPIKKRTQR